MALKKLSAVNQSLFSASIWINNYKTVVEELIYNSLDAESLSIAVRVNVPENRIQVVDNGHGVEKCDFVLLGQNNVTSKFIDISTLKSAPTKYGFRGRSLASIIAVSQSVKFTSRCETTKDTWIKTFHRGKERDFSAGVTRPSKGTTVDIKGFLYNLNIQKNNVDPLNELNNIKAFLEQLSLVHSNISLSLRDDSKNYIVFKVHKNRNIYQTLSSVFGIDQGDLQELQVEKNEYKVKAYIGKKDKELNQIQWIYLNGKYLYNCQLYKIINKSFTKTNTDKNLKDNGSKKAKLKGYNEKEISVFNNGNPFYLMFITCPYNEYDINYTPKQSILEFKNWEQITKLLQKLVQFYIGDKIALKEIPKSDNIQIQNKENNNDTRLQVKYIMDKILGNHSKKIEVSHMQNGIKGKVMKRKKRKETLNISDSKVISTNKNDASVKFQDNNLNAIQVKSSIKSYNKTEPKEIKLVEISNKIQQINNKPKIKKENKHLNKKHRVTKKVLKKVKKVSRKSDNIINNFKKETNTVRKRCNVLHKEVENLMSYVKNKKFKIHINKTIQCNTMYKNNKNVSIYKRKAKILADDYTPLPQNLQLNSFNRNFCNESKKKSFKTSYDILQTILKSQQEKLLGSLSNQNEVCYKNNNFNLYQSNFELEQTGSDLFVPRHTFQSHNYYKQEKIEKRTNIDMNNHSIFTIRENTPNHVQRKRYKIKSPKNLSPKFKMPYNKTETSFNRYNNFINKGHILEKSYSIEFSKIKENFLYRSANDKNDNELNFDMIESCEDEKAYNTYMNNDCTYTIRASESLSKVAINFQKHSFSKEYSYNRKYSEQLSRNNTESYRNFSDQKENKNLENDLNVIFISKSQDSHVFETFDKDLNPLDICEVILNNHDNLEREYNSADIRIDSLLYNDSENTPFYNKYIRPRSKENSLKITEVRNGFEKVCNVSNTDKHTSFFLDNNEINNEKIDRVNKKVDPLLDLKITNTKHNIINPVKSFIRANQEIICINTETVSKNNCDTHFIDNFNFKNRLRFLPKGLSPIFENCNTKSICNYNLDKDYYENSIYNNFVNYVQINSEIFEPRIQNAKELTTRDIEKINNRMDKDKASLIFNGQSLRKAKVLGQVDNKFIAAILEGTSNYSEEISDFLVLFDQHAVHERINLENNLTEYLVDNQWQSIALDISLNLSMDEYLYLNNYEEKFTKLGLQWTVLNSSEVLISAVPRAIFGKHPRQLDTIMKTIKQLISEEINIIKTQKGCISLYPKAIMNLVFSEACRYAIKFGDSISKIDCKELLNALSECHTPFQCAHGRPVMAVLIKLKPVKRQYKVNLTNIPNQFKKYST